MIGSLIASRYRVNKQIGAGGMGVVYEAHDKLLQRDVAIKVIQPHLVEDSAVRDRFLKEAQSVAGLLHQNIVIIYDLIVDEPGQEVYIIMELLSGESLRQAENRGTIPSFSSLASQLSAALHAAHMHGILHRDIKPENIFICDNGTVKLMDFGLACLLTSSTRTQSGMMAGTIGYMAPEQLKDLQIDERSDLYSLGIVLYELLSGQIPFASDNPGAMLLKRLTTEPRPLQEITTNLDPTTAQAVMSLLHSDPQLRPRSAAEFASSLDSNIVRQQSNGSKLAEHATLNFRIPTDVPNFTVDKSSMLRKVLLYVGGVSSVAIISVIIIGMMTEPRQVKAHAHSFNNLIASTHVIPLNQKKVNSKAIQHHKQINYYKLPYLNSYKVQEELSQQSKEIQELQKQLELSQKKATISPAIQQPTLNKSLIINSIHRHHKVGFFHVQLLPDYGQSSGNKKLLLISAKEPHFLACYVYRPKLHIATRERIFPSYINVNNGNSTMIKLVNKSHMPTHSMLIVLGSPEPMNGLPEALTMEPLLNAPGGSDPIRSAGKLILEELMPSLKVSHLDIRFIRYHSGDSRSGRMNHHNSYRSADATMVGP